MLHAFRVLGLCIACFLIMPMAALGQSDVSEDITDEEAFALSEEQLSDLEEAHAAYLENNNLQLERPENDPIEPPPRPPRAETPGWLSAIGDFFNVIFSFLGPLAAFIFWGALALIVLGILYFIFGEALNARFGRSGKGKIDQEDDVLVDLRPDAATAKGLLEEADALARQGKFADAVHLLLFRSIQDIQKRLDGGVPRSLTAREIGGLSTLPDRARKALSPIIRIVEFSFFGGRDVDEDGWKTARASYEDFAFGEAWS